MYFSSLLILWHRRFANFQIFKTLNKESFILRLPKSQYSTWIKNFYTAPFFTRPFLLKNHFYDLWYVFLLLTKDIGTPSAAMVAFVVIPLSSSNAQISTNLISFLTWFTNSPFAVEGPLRLLCWCIVKPNHRAIFPLHTKPYPMSSHRINKSIHRIRFNNGEICWHFLAFVLSII